MKKNNLCFILHSKVIINTIEYIFIGDNDCDIEINNTGSCLHEIYCKEPQIVVYEFDASLDIEENWKKILNLRYDLAESISLVVFSEDPMPLTEKAALESEPIRIVAQDNFFLDNLFGVISEELNRQTVLYQM